MFLDLKLTNNFTNNMQCREVGLMASDGERHFWIRVASGEKAQSCNPGSAKVSSLTWQQFWSHLSLQDVLWWRQFPFDSSCVILWQKKPVLDDLPPVVIRSIAEFRPILSCHNIAWEVRNVQNMCLIRICHNGKHIWFLQEVSSIFSIYLSVMVATKNMADFVDQY